MKNGRFSYRKRGFSRLCAALLTVVTILSGIPAAAFSEEPEPTEPEAAEQTLLTQETAEQTAPPQDWEIPETPEAAEESEATEQAGTLLEPEENQALEEAELPLPEEPGYAPEIPDDFAPPIAQGYGALYTTQLPQSYDARRLGVVTAPRSQGPWELCWAFAALASGESSLLSRGLAEQSVNLSERHLGAYFSGPAVDPLGNAVGDGTYLTTNYLQSGGNNKFTTFALANWVGAAGEADYPYDLEPDTANRARALDDRFHMENAYWISARDTENIKKMVMVNGAVAMSIYYSTSFYNPQTFAFYNDSYSTTNHAIAVIGWDDNFPAENFRTRPETDGAWLCKNSAGTAFGDEGFFWVSYCDESLNAPTATAFVFEFDRADKYQWNYHYDGAFGTLRRQVSEGGSIANVFRACADEDGSNEIIQAVGFALASADVDYSLQIYSGLTNPADPTSGVPVWAEPQRGRTVFSGYYTVELDEPVTVGSGELFSVVLTLESCSDSTLVSYFADGTYNNGSWIQFQTQTAPGQSFVRAAEGSWQDLAGLGRTARLKAFTTTQAGRKPTQLHFEQDSVLLYPGETCDQQPIAFPADTDPVRLSWTSSNEAVATVADDGTVLALTEGETEITAAGFGGRLQARYRVTVKPPLRAVRLTWWGTQMRVGETVQLEVELLPAEASGSYVPEIRSSDSTVARVVGTTLTAVKPGKTTITVTAGRVQADYALTVVKPLDGVSMEVEPVIFDGSPARPEPRLYLDGTLLRLGEDYTLSWRSNQEPGTGIVRAAGAGLYTGQAEASFEIVMAVPELDRAENSDKGIRLQWTNAAGSGGCSLYRSVNGGKWTLLRRFAPNTTEYTDTGANLGGARYAYRLSSNVTVGRKCYESDPSEPIIQYRLAKANTPSLRKNEQGFVLSWSAVPGADEYAVYRCRDGESAVLLALMPQKTRNYTDSTPLEPGVGYRYWITARKQAENELWVGQPSKDASVIPLGAPTVGPPENTQRGIRLTWNSVPGADFYQVQRKTGTAKWSVLCAKTTDTSLVDTRANIPGGKYWYRVVPITKLGGAAYTGPASQEAGIYWVPAPRITGMTLENGAAKLQWTPVRGAQGYTVLRNTDAEPEQPVSPEAPVAAGIEYQYCVKAYLEAEGQRWESGASPKRTLYCPSAVQSVRVENGAGVLNISWEECPGAVGYEVYRSTDGTTWNRVAGNKKTSAAVRAGASGSVSFWRVQAYTLLDGKIIRGVPSDAVAHRYLAPVGSASAKTESAGVRIRWNSHLQARSYRVYRITAKGESLLYTCPAGVLEFLDTDAPRGQICRYGVTACGEEALEESAQRLSNWVIRR